MVLEETVFVESTVEIPQEVTPDSIFLDLWKNPKAMAVLAPLVKVATEGLSGGEERSEAAASAITDEMNQAMLKYTPLRSIASFSDGAVTYEQIQELIRRIH